jgi:SAM-dependent methyltransferase
MNEKPISNLIKAHLDRIREHYDHVSKIPSKAQSYRRILARYYNLLIPGWASVLEVGCGAGDLLSRLNARKRVGVDVSETQINLAKENIPGGEFHVQAGETLDLPDQQFDYVVLSETANFAADIQRVLERARTVADTETRLILNIYNVLWRPLIWLATVLGWRNPQPESNWLSKADLQGLLYLSGWEWVRSEARILCPIELLGLERFINRFLAPLCPPLCLSLFVVARPLSNLRQGSTPRQERSVSVVIPARNEAGNIAAAVARTPEMGVWTELIFVEGNSTDNTWEAIQKVRADHPGLNIKILKQPGKGKGDAVRAGFAAAEGDILMILDADLTVPPEELPKFYDALVSRACEFANGSRLVYPMDDKAMQFLNLCANKTFGIVFSWLLGQPIKDTLCGTKVLSRANYQKIAGNRSYFGDFDPFGDFDLLFGASKLSLKILDLPIRYKERVYGQTNIQRWKHGWLLLEMVVFAASKLKFVG